MAEQPGTGGLGQAPVEIQRDDARVNIQLVILTAYVGFRDRYVRAACRSAA